MILRFIGGPSTGRPSIFTVVLVQTVTVVLALSGLVVLTSAAPAAAAEPISLETTASPEVLVGGSVTYRLSLTNDGEDELYNASYRAVLPVGVTYRAGSSRPEGFGDPTVLVDPEDGRQTLLWRNVSDLAVGQTVTLRFSADADADALPVGSTAEAETAAYANDDPRLVPRFSADGRYRDRATAQAAGTSSTAISALAVTKSEPSPENELLRGVHDNTTVYRITVENNGAHPTNGVTVVDYLPAQLEFLGSCGVVDASTGEEYPGSGPMQTATTGADCLEPTSVTTVDDDLPSGYPAGVYTRVEWTVGDLSGGQERVISYRAGIPMRANEMPSEEAADGFTSTANLDNNTGPSTRETTVEQELVNRVRAAGTYTGQDVTGAVDTRVAASATQTVTAEDLAIRKSVDRRTFVQGGVATYTLHLRGSEYTTADRVVVTDEMANGLCPLDATRNFSPSAITECEPGAGFAQTGARIASATDNGAEGYRIVFDEVELDRNGRATITYQARMRTTYSASENPTAAGDEFDNTVALSARTSSIEAQQPPEEDEISVEVSDESGASLASDGPRLVKEVARSATPMDCDTATYTAESPDAEDLGFAKGSRVCFRIRVDFPTGSATRDPRVTDFLPDTLAYESGSARTTEENDVEVEVTDSAAGPSFAIGEVRSDRRYVAPGGTFEVVLSGIVKESGADEGEVTGNLAKFRWLDSRGRASSLRDDVDFFVPPPPPVTIEKKVAERGDDPAYVDSRVTRHGEQVRYRLRVANEGSAESRTALPTRDVVVWDQLPAGTTCESVVVGGAGECTDTADRGRIAWTIDALEPGERIDLTYVVTVPTSYSVDLAYDNTAGVRTFTTPTNLAGTSAEHFPADNIDPTVEEDRWDAPAATDTAAVRLPAVAVTKSNRTEITPTSSPVADAGNGESDAVSGEGITYTIGVTVPARSTVYRGVLDDPMPADIGFLGASVAYPEGVDDEGFTLDPETGRLTFPTTYTNATDEDQTFTVTVQARSQPGQTATGDRVNRATFTSTQNSLGGGQITPRWDESTVVLVAPDPSIAKTSEPGDHAVAGQLVTYTLRASNASGRPTLQDSVVTDCVPAGLTLEDLPSAATQEPGTSGNECAGGTLITWQVGALEAGADGARALQYTARTSPSAAAGTRLTNSARITGSTLRDGSNGITTEATLSDGTSKTVTMRTATVTKEIADRTLTIGEQAEYTVSARLFAGLNYFNASITDTLPAGLDPDSVTGLTFACTDVETGEDCTTPDGVTSLERDGRTVGWLMGDLGTASNDRVVTLTFAATVADTCRTAGDTACNTAGKVRPNTAALSWDAVSGTPPTSAGATFGQTSSSNRVDYTVVEPTTDLTKTVSNTRPAPGDVFTYTVTASNPGGPSTSVPHGVVVQDVVPAGVVVDTDSITRGGRYDAEKRTITWTLGSPLGVGAANAVPLTYRASLAPSAELGAAGLVNRATVTSFTSLPDGAGRTYAGDDRPSATVTPRFPRVNVTKGITAGAEAFAGQPKTFTVTATSAGSTAARNVTVSDVLPENWTLTGTPTVRVGTGASTPLSPTVEGRTLTWSRLAPGGLPNGQTIVITYQATPSLAALVTPGVGGSVDHVNTVSVTAEDATGARASRAGAYHGPAASAVARILSADLAVEKTATGIPVAGRETSWTIAVAQNGPDRVSGPITVVDTLPDDVTGARASGPGWSCSPATGTITCTRPGPADKDADLPDITVTATVPSDLEPGTELRNAVSVSSDTHDPVEDNDTDTVTTETRALADLAITKRLSGGLTAGDVATYTLDVRNVGPSTSRGEVTVTDELPDGTTFRNVDGGETWECGHADGVVTCTADADVPVGGPMGQIVVAVEVAADRVEPVVNTAKVEGSTPEPDTAAAKENDSSTVRTTPERTAALSMSKNVAGDAPLTAGTEGTYRLEIVNNGPSTATGVRVTDRLPGYFTFVRGGGDGWSCAASGQLVTCDLDGSIGVGADAGSGVDLVVAVDQAHTGVVANTADVVATEDPDGTSATSVDGSVVDVRSDLEITKSHPDERVLAGGRLTFRLDVANRGPSAAVGPFEVVDTLPEGMTFVSGGDADWTCEADGAEVTCSSSQTLASGQGSGFPITVDVASSAGPATLTNRAAVSAEDVVDPVLGNNITTDEVLVEDDVEIGITKTSLASTAHAGDRTSWGISVTNDGPSDADKVTVTDQVPAGLSVISASGDGWECGTTTGSLECSRPTLAPGTAPVITVVTAIGSGVPDGTVLRNVATVTTTSSGNETEDDSNGDDVTVTTSADLVLDKSHLEETATAGETTRYRIAVRNDGPSDARGPVQVKDRLPRGLTYVGVADGWTCDAGEVDESGQDVECELVGEDAVIVADEAAPDLVMTVAVGATTAGRELPNTASVTSDTDDPDPGNNEDTASVTPTGSADLSITKSHRGPVEVGEDVTFDLRVRNDGPSEARGVLVEDELPAGLTLVSAGGEQWSCDGATCRYADNLAPGDVTPVLQVVATVEPGAYPEVTNVATVSSDTADPDAENDTVRDDVTVPAKVDLRIAKELVGNLTVGQEGTYRLTVGNEGLTADPGPVTVTDQLPAGLTYVDASGDGWQCAHEAGLVSCVDEDGLAVDEVTTIDLTVAVGAASYPSVANTARVTTGAVDVDVENNVSSIESPVGGSARLSLDKSLADSDGADATWRLKVTNHGPTETTEPVKVVDRLPRGLQAVGASGDGWVCQVERRVVTCVHDAPIGVSASSTVDVRTRITVDDGRTILNEAEILSGGTTGDDGVASAAVDAPGGSPLSGLLPETGGPVWWLLLLGMIALVAGRVLLERDSAREWT